MQIIPYALIALVVLAAWRTWIWLKEGEARPDPWGPEIGQAINSPEALPVCHHCFTPQEQETCFCLNCGAAVGPYNNYLPFIYLFSEGEVFRNGVNNRFAPSVLIVGGYVLLSLVSYSFFAPVYWFFLCKNLVRNKATSESTSAAPV